MIKKHTLLIYLLLIFSFDAFGINNISKKYTPLNKAMTKHKRSAEALWDYDNWIVLEDVEGWIYDDLLDFYIFGYDKDPDFTFFANAFDGYEQKIMNSVDYYEYYDDEGNGYSLSYENGKPNIYKTNDSLEVVDYDYNQDGMVSKITYEEGKGDEKNIYYITFIYNQDNKVISLNFYYDEEWNNEFKLLERNTLTYNVDGTLKEIESQSRDNESADWNTDGKDIYEYQGDTLIVSTFVESWDNQGEFELEYKSIKIFDDASRVIATWEVSYSSESDSSISEMYQYFYSINNDTIDVIVSEDVQGQLVEAYKVTDVFNEAGQMFEELFYNASESGGWDAPSKASYNYNSENSMENCLFYEWDSQVSDFIKTDSTAFIYDEFGHPDSVIAFRYDKYLKEYQLDYYENFNFPQSNPICRTLNIIKMSSEFRFNLNSKIKESAKIYDLQGRLIAVLKPEENDEGVFYKLHSENLAKGKLLIFSIDSRNNSIRKSFILKK